MKLPTILLAMFFVLASTLAFAQGAGGGGAGGAGAGGAGGTGGGAASGSSGSAGGGGPLMANSRSAIGTTGVATGQSTRIKKKHLR